MAAAEITATLNTAYVLCAAVSSLIVPPNGGGDSLLNRPQVLVAERLLAVA